MGTVVAIIIGVVVIGAVINALSSPQTKLFRRIWSTERTGQEFGSHRREAVEKLLQQHNVNFQASSEALDDAVGSLLAASVEFDLTHKNNLGVQITSVLSKEVLNRIPQGQHLELRKKLMDTQRMDVVAFAQSVKKTTS
jgi:uncharacterized FlaG/YvyC family protein